MPDIVDGYDYLKENVLPGEKFTAMEQCQRAFGRRFVPHVKPDESPFDVRDKIVFIFFTTIVRTLNRTYVMCVGP